MNEREKSYWENIVRASQERKQTSQQPRHFTYHVNGASDLKVFYVISIFKMAFQVAQQVRNLHVMQIRPLGGEDPRKEGMAMHLSVLA